MIFPVFSKLSVSKDVSKDLRPVLTALVLSLGISFTGIFPATTAGWAQPPLVIPPDPCASRSTVNDASTATDKISETRLHLAETQTISFQNDFQDVLNQAMAYLQENHRRRGAVVLDLDETLLDNRAYFTTHDHFDQKLWDEWIDKIEAPGIPQTVAFVGWLNQHHFKIYFVSGRRERQREQTEWNLRKVGITHYNGLYLKANDYNKSSATDFKVAAQQDIEHKGDHVLAVIGDQNSDLKNALGKGFKLPNPIYTIP